MSRQRPMRFPAIVGKSVRGKTPRTMTLRLPRHPALLPAVLLIAAITKPAPAQDRTTTFYKDILPVFQKYCIDCHHTGGPAPQSLETYDLARSWLRTSRSTMREGTMPPWFADSGADQWRNAVLPSPEEIDLVSNWVKEGAEPGDEADAPAPLDFSAEWRLGTPDLVLQMPDPVDVASGQPDLYHNAILDPGFSADTWLTAVELKPGSMNTVRQLSLSVVPPEVAASLPVDAFNLREFEGHHDLAFWNRGMSLIEPYPQGAGVLVPAGWKLVLQAHYKAGEQGGADRSSVGLHLASGPPAAPYVTVAAENRDFTLPVDAYDFEVHASTTLEHGLRVESILPRMHYLGLGLAATATLPDGTERRLIRISNYDFRMQTLYSATQPIELPAGTRINVTAFYENSPDNPHNPNTAMADVPYGPPPAGETLAVVLRGTRY